MLLKDKQRLVRVMTEQEVSVRQLGAACGVSHSMIQQLRSGRRTSCMPALAVQIAKRLSVGVDYLFAVNGSSGAGLSDQRGRVTA